MIERIFRPHSLRTHSTQHLVLFAPYAADQLPSLPRFHCISDLGRIQLANSLALHVVDAYDDRIELPEGFQPEIVGPDAHPILAGLGRDWPPLLGFNEVSVKASNDAQLLAKLPDAEGGHPLLVTGAYGNGCVVAWTSDIGPHWLPPEFAAWPGYARLWRQTLAWITRSSN